MYKEREVDLESLTKFGLHMNVRTWHIIEEVDEQINDYSHASFVYILYIIRIVYYVWDFISL